MSTPSKKTAATATVTAHSKSSENSNPNHPSPFKSRKSEKSASKTTLGPPPPPPANPQPRKFIVAKKSSRRAVANAFDFDKCRREALETLRASHDDFFRRNPVVVNPSPVKAVSDKNPASFSDSIAGGSSLEKGGFESPKCSKSRKLEEGMPEPGSGMVRHLVKAFEGMLSLSSEKAREVEELGSGSEKIRNWALPGMAGMDEIMGDSVFSSGDYLRSDARLCRSLDSEDGRVSWGRRNSGGGRRSRRNSSESMKRSWNEKLKAKATSLHPFKLRTELRGRLKQEQFLKKVNEMLVEEEKKRIPIAQGLPWTTDEPEVLLKPPVKQNTEPIEVVLHSDVRAVERAEFDNYVEERISFAEQLRLERERQKKLEEEEEVRRLRKELVPKAQPMPFFDRPFIPKRSEKPQTIPKEPRFHVRPKKNSCSTVSLLR